MHITKQHPLEKLLTNRLCSGLKRSSIIKPSKWAETYRVMGKPFNGPWTFKRHPWLREMHDSEAELNVGQKAAQMGFTETVLNVVFYYIDMHGVDCLYVLPSKTPDASDFSAARFDAALELSTHLKEMFSNVKNVGHKRAGNTNLYIRGAKSRSGLKSVPVGVLILDEKDEMNQDNIPLAKERQSGYDFNKTWEISTPTVDGVGINKTFTLSTQNEFFFTCKSCSRLINLTFPDSMEIIGEDFDDPRLKESYLKCHKCQAKIPNEQKTEWLSTGRWVPKFEGRSIEGWGVSQLYSSTITPQNFLESYFKAKIDPADEQEFYNSKLGIPHIVKGAKVNESDIEACIKEYLTHNENSTGLVTMGVDVGTVLHFEITKWQLSNTAIDLNVEARPQVLAVGKVSHFEELDILMRTYNVTSCVVDMQPERRKAYEFASRFWGRVKLCIYGNGVQGKRINLGQEDELTITVDRTSWLDLSLSRFKNNSISLPRDTPREYKRHIRSLIRIYEKDGQGNPVGKYVKSGSEADHFAHARNYNEIALPLAASIGQTHTIYE